MRIGAGHGFACICCAIYFARRAVDRGNSVTTPKLRRMLAWERLVRDLDMAKLHALMTTVKLDDVPQVAEEIVAGKVRGRVVVELS